MPNFNPIAAQIVADDIRTSFSGLDTSMQDSANILKIFVEAVSAADLPPSQSQRTISALGNSIMKSIESRAHMIEAQRAMVLLKGKSNLDVFDFGCWMGAQDKSIPAIAEEAA